MSFSVTGVTLRDTQVSESEKVSKVVVCDRCDTLARFSEDDLHVSWQARHFGDLHRHFAWHAQHFGRVLLRILFCNLRCQGCAKW